MNYVELHLHTHYSRLDGLNTSLEYMERAKEIGITHLAITDHGTLSGHREHQRAGLETGVTPILGLEAYISETDRFDRRANNKREDGTKTYNHIGLLAMNEVGLTNLNRLSSEAWQSGFYNKPRIDRELLEEFNEGLVVTSGCLNGLLAKALEADDYARALQRAEWFKKVFGDRYFIEIQGHNPKNINLGLQMIGDQLNIPLVVTSDCHYARKEDLWVEEAMLILSTSPKVAKGFDFDKSQKMDWLDRFNYLYPDRQMTFQEYQIYLRSAVEQKEMLAVQGFDEQPILNTMLVANMIGEYPYHEALDLLPNPGVENVDDELHKRAWEGLRSRGMADDAEAVARLTDELRVIKDKGFSTYFLILWDVMAFARGRGIWVGPGRGSGVSSLVNYCLYITNINPMDYKLLFFRFLDPDRDDMPDIDVDFEVSRRHEIKEYVNKKYGHTANIATIGYFRDKSSIKAAARVLKVSPGLTNIATKPIQTMEDYENSPATEDYRKKFPEVLTLAKRLNGRIQNMGMHAGGTVISKEPIENYAPMETAKDPQNPSGERVPVMAYDMTEAASIGMIKYDFLGLTSLTIVKDTVELIKARHGVEINPYDLPLDDPKVYEMLSAGRTKAVFQCEGGPYTQKIIEMGGVWCFDDLISSNALVRPGASNSSIGKNYIKGKNTGEFEYIHADTKYFTEETFGQILFQEQQMLLCVEVAGMSMKEANQVRQAIGKKIYDKLIKWKPIFIEGAANKIGLKKAEAVWDDLEASAQYAFNKAHSVGYSMLSYWTAWFKANYPLEFMTVVLNNEKDKNSRLDYLVESKRMGLKILLPHISGSQIENTIENNSIRLGLNNIKFISNKVGANIMEGGPYYDYASFLKVANKKYSGINTAAVGALNKVGAAAFEDNPRTGTERENFFEFLGIPVFDNKELPVAVKSQFRTMEEYTSDDTFIICGMVRDIKNGTGWSLIEVVDETGYASAFTSGNTPIEKGQIYIMLVSSNRVSRFFTVSDFVEGRAGSIGKYLEKDDMGLKPGQYRCLSFKARTSKGGTRMADIVLTDHEKNLSSAMLFDGSRGAVNAAQVRYASGAIVTPVFGESRTGATIIKEP